MRPYSPRAIIRPRRKASRLRLHELEDRTVPTLDPTFGIGGKQTIDFGDQASDSGEDVAVQPDGKIVVVARAAYSAATGVDFGVTRLNSDGSLDSSFNVTGKQTIDFGGSAGDLGQSVALQADGKILVAGYSEQVPGDGGLIYCAVARLNPDGSLDQSFGVGGRATFDFQNPSINPHYSVAVQGDKIVVAGTAAVFDVGYAFLVARLNNDGSLDTSFGDEGTRTIDAGTGESYAFDVSVQADSKIVVGGFTYGGASNSWDYAVARLTSNGAIDTSFNGTGKQSVDFGGSYDNASSVAIQGDKILIAGHVGTGNRDFGVARLNSDGTFDTAFNGTGNKKIDFGAGSDTAWSIATKDDKIVLAGATVPAGGGSNFAIARLNYDGSLDTSFNGTGKETIDFGTGNNHGYGVAVQGDGKVVVVGSAHAGSSTGYDIAVVRTTAGAVTWDGGGGDFNWNNPANWNNPGAADPNTLPGPSDDVVIDFGANDFTIDVAGISTSIRSISSLANLHVDDGTLLVGEDSHLYGTLTIVRGVFGGSGDIIVDGLFTWAHGNTVSYGILQGVNGQGSLTALGGTNIPGYAGLNGFHFINPVGQTATWGGGALYLSNQATFDNQGTLVLAGNTDMTGNGTFHNAGTVTKTAGTGTSYFRTVTVNNLAGAALEVQTGGLTLGVAGGQVTNAGVISGANNTSIGFNGQVTSTGSIAADDVYWGTQSAVVSGSYQSQSIYVDSVVPLTGPVSGLGDVYVNYTGTLDISGAALTPQAKALSQLTLQAGKLISDDDLTVTGLFTWAHGNTVSYGILQGVNGQGSLTALGGTNIPGYAGLNGFHFINPVGQTATWGGGALYLSNQATFDNQGTLVLAGNTDMTGNGTFHNAGTVTKTAGTGTSYFRTVTVNNLAGAALEVQTGGLTLGVAGGQVTNAGVISGANNTSIGFNGQVTSTGSIAADDVYWGTQSAVVSGSYQSQSIYVDSVVPLTGPVSGLGDVYVNYTGTLDISGAALTPQAKALSQLTLQAGKLISDDDLTVTGLFTWAHGNTVSYGILQGVNGQGSLTALGGTNIPGYAGLNGFHFINPVGQTATWGGGALYLSNQATFDNQGTLVLAGNTDMTGNGTFHNAGTVTKTAGTGTSYFRTVTVNNLAGAALEVQTGGLTLGVAGGQVTNAGVISGANNTSIGFNGQVTSTGSIAADDVYWGTQSAVVSGSYQSQSIYVDSVVPLTGPVSGLGDVYVNYTGTLDISGAALTPQAKALSQLTLQAGKLISDDDLTVTGLFTWAHGNTVSYGILQGVNGQGSLTALGGTNIPGYAGLNGFHFINPVGQTATWGGGALYLSNQATFDNQGTLVLAGNTDMTGNGTFHNAGTVTKTAGTGTSFFRTVTVDNGAGALIDVQVGSLGLGLSEGSLSNQGSIVVAAGANLSLGTRLDEQISGSVAGTQYGHIISSGTIHLSAGISVIVPAEFSASVGQTFTIVSSGSSGSVDGQFNALAEGEEVTDNQGNRYAISYVRGSGHDVVLTTTFVSNQSPVPDAGGPYDIDEGQTLTLDASGTTDSDNDPLTLDYSWTINGHAAAASGINPTLTWAELDALGVNDGSGNFDVLVTASDGVYAVTSGPAALNVVNVAPTAAIVPPVGAVRFQSRTFTLNATDPSSVDQAAGFTFEIDWDGDGTYDETQAGPSGLTATHTYTSTGTYNVHVTARDKDGLTGGPTTYSLVVGVAQVQGNDLAVGGTTGADRFVISPGAAGHFIAVLNGTRLGNFIVPGNINLYAAGGTDLLTVNGTSVVDSFDILPGAIVMNGTTIAAPEVETWIVNGKAGNDTFNLLGGITTINGNSGSDLLFNKTPGSHLWMLNDGGSGALDGVSYSGIERLTGGAGDDTFLFQDDASFSGPIDGGGGTDTLDYSAVGTSFTVNLQTGVFPKTGGTAGIEQIIGSYDETDKLIGPNTSNVWRITDMDAGTLNDSVSYIGFESITGGTDSDRFDFLAGASVSGTLAAVGGIDTVDFSSFGAPVSVNLTTHLATAVTSLTSVEVVVGSSAADNLVGSGADDSLDGGAGDDTLIGNGGGDTLLGGDGNDSLDGGAGTDALFGGADDDWLTGGAASDLLDGGSGLDTLVESGNVNMTLTDTSMTMTGLGTDVLVAIDYGQLTGGLGNNKLNAAAFTGSVTLIGGDGNDSLTGGIGNDLLDGGAGTDTLDGGLGTDVGLNGEVLLNIP